MSLKIRLARAGTKKRPVYHIVIADSRSPRDGRYIERLGYFNPLLPKDKAERIKLDLDKVKAWLAKGALPTDRVLRFLDQAGVMKREPRNNPLTEQETGIYRGEVDEGTRDGGAGDPVDLRSMRGLQTPREVEVDAGPAVTGPRDRC